MRALPFVVYLGTTRCSNYSMIHANIVDLKVLRPSLLALVMTIPRIWISLMALTLPVGFFSFPAETRAQGFNVTLKDIQMLHGKADKTFEAGDFELARKLYQNVMGYRMRRQGAKAYEIGAIHNNLGVMQYNEGDYDKAIELFEKALANIRGTKGGDHPEAAICLCNIGFAMVANGKGEDAKELFQEALKTRLRRLGLAHPDIADCHEGIGLCHSAKNESDEAIEAFQKCLAIRQKAYGEDNVETAAAYMGLSMAYLGKNEFDKVDEYDGKALAILKKTAAAGPINRNPESQLKGPAVRVFKARSKLKRKL